MLLSMQSLTQGPKPRNRRYQSVREYLSHGPPIHMDYSEFRRNDWAAYERDVEHLLEDPETAAWLDGPLGQAWSRILHQQAGTQDHKSAYSTTCGSRAARRLDSMAMCGGILFWVSNITAALAFVLITNTPGSNRHPMAEL